MRQIESAVIKWLILVLIGTGIPYMLLPKSMQKQMDLFQIFHMCFYHRVYRTRLIYYFMYASTIDSDVLEGDKGVDSGFNQYRYPICSTIEYVMLEGSSISNPYYASTIDNEELDGSGIPYILLSQRYRWILDFVMNIFIPNLLRPQIQKNPFYIFLFSKHY